jgi:hypothetical protein
MPVLRMPLLLTRQRPPWIVDTWMPTLATGSKLGTLIETLLQEMEEWDRHTPEMELDQ